MLQVMSFPFIENYSVVVDYDDDDDNDDENEDDDDDEDVWILDYEIRNRFNWLDP